MKQSVGLALVLLIGCATGAMIRDVVAPARAQGQTGPNYEYDVVLVANNIGNDKEALLRFGREGWRLAAATQNGPYRNLYFERQVK